MIPSLVEAKPRTLSGLMPWESLRERLEDQNPRTLRALLEVVTRDVEVVTRDVIDGMHPRSFGIREQYLGVKGERIEELLKAALMIGTIRAFAADPIPDKAFALKMFAWGPVPLPHREEDTSARQIGKLVDAIMMGADALALNAKLKQLEGQKAAFEHKLATAPDAEPLIHPALATIYRDTVEKLEVSLRRLDTGWEAFQLIRGLIDAVVLTPVDGKLEIEPGRSGRDPCAVGSQEY